MRIRRTLVWLGVLGVAILACGLFAVSFPANYPDHTLTIGQRLTVLLDGITLPLKLAKLSMQEPDATILMPVHDKKVATVTDTWHVPRGTDRVHEGQDIFAPKGTPVFSAVNGYVRRTGVSELGGNIVFVTGAGGRRYYYAHLDRVAHGLHAGQPVTTDTVLGFVGNTGNAITTPSHLHFGLYEGREALNPLPLLRDR